MRRIWVWGLAALIVFAASYVLLGNQRVAHASTVSGGDIANGVFCFLDKFLTTNVFDTGCAPTPTTGTLTVIKTVVGTSTPSSDFNIHVASSTEIITSPQPGDSSGTAFGSLTPGSYVVSETAGTGVSLSDYTAVYSGACDSSGNVTVIANQNVTCTITNTYIAPTLSADLSVAKTADNSTPHEGDEVTYTITVTNDGPDDASNVVVTDTLPSGLTFVATSSADTVGVYANGSGTWTVGPLTNGGSATLHVTASVNSGTAGNTIVNTASVSSSTSDPTSGNNTSSPSITVQTNGGGGPTTGTLIIAKYTDTGNDTFSFPIWDGAATTTETITTSGGAGTTTVSNLAPGTYDVTEATSSAWSVGSVSCVYDGSSIGSSILNGEAVTLAAGDAVTCTFRNVHADGTFSDLSVTKTVDDSSPDVGQQVTYTVTVTNNGPDTASSAIVSDQLPSGLTFVATSSADTGEYDAGTGTWTVGDLADGASATLHIIASVNSGTEGDTIVNNASASSESTDGTPGNDIGSASLTVNTPSNNGGGGSPTPTNTGGGGGGGNGPITGTFGGGGGGIVLGASTTTIPTGAPSSCGALISTYMRRGFAHNDPAEVKKLQQFLNDNLGLNLPVTGYFGSLTEAAVDQFQQKYAADVLTPWNINAPTGFVYLTTRRWINLLYCQSLSIPIPPLVPYSQRGGQ